MPTLALPHDDVHSSVISSDPLVRQVWNEYVEMPGLRLTREQAQRLLGVDETTCRQLLDRLVQVKLLVFGSDGRYGRGLDAANGALSTARMLKTTLPSASRHLVKTG